MEVPVGAVIVKDDIVIGAGYNKKENNRNPLSHAEIEAIYEACRNTDNWRLNGTCMYVTAEPCIMCAGAILHARIDKVYFGVFEYNCVYFLIKFLFLLINFFIFFVWINYFFFLNY